MKERYVYGPVPSRRLGRSLGVDLVPHKVCSYDCLYCQIGRTTKKTIARKPYMPVDEILNQLEGKLKEGPRPDYITLAGSGEPTLHSELGTLIHRIKALSSVPVAVLTNGSLLGNRRVREALMKADAVLPSLDAHDQKGFEAINRPHPDITFETMVNGLIDFRKDFSGEIWLEIFLLDGINATVADALKFKDWVDKLSPEKVHINTAVRPTAEAFARQVLQEQMEQFCGVLGENAEVIAPFEDSKKHEKGDAMEEDLLNLLARRPCTLDDMASGLNVHRNDLLKYLDPLLKNQTIQSMRKGSQIYYQAGDVQ
ncbi:MAG: radical SAM protein [Deltaproteobacteria bacterium]|nr:radical SAM protein [Deltaproteobacteria bacterium]